MSWWNRRSIEVTGKAPIRLSSCKALLTTISAPCAVSKAQVSPDYSTADSSAQERDNQKAAVCTVFGCAPVISTSLASLKVFTRCANPTGAIATETLLPTHSGLNTLLFFCRPAASMWHPQKSLQWASKALASYEAIQYWKGKEKEVVEHLLSAFYSLPNRYLGTEDLETLMLLCGVSPAVQVQDSALSSGNHREIPLHLHFLRQEMAHGLPAPPLSLCFRAAYAPRPCVCGYVNKSFLCCGAAVPALCHVQAQGKPLHVSLREKNKTKHINTGLDFFGGPSWSSLLTISGRLELSGNTWEVAIPQWGLFRKKWHPLLYEPTGCLSTIYHYG